MGQHPVPLGTLGWARVATRPIARSAIAVIAAVTRLNIRARLTTITRLAASAIRAAVTRLAGISRLAAMARLATVTRLALATVLVHLSYTTLTHPVA
jgi:hypothetical protein